MSVVDGATILVGNRALLDDHVIEVPRFASNADTSSEVFVARSGQFLGAIVIADTTRPEARRAIEALAQMGIRSILLTGDSRPVAATVARELAISEVEAELLPEMKLARIRSLVASGRVVAMVGDGVNAPPTSAEPTQGLPTRSATTVP